MGSINRKTLVRESNTHENHGTGGLLDVTLLQLDMSSYLGYNYGNTGNAALATLDLKIAGIRGSGGPSVTRNNGEWVIHLRREAAGAPAVTTFADANNAGAGISFDISGNIFRVRLNVLGTVGIPTIMLAELFGDMIDYTTP